jgi:hypothetical protein
MTLKRPIGLLVTVLVTAACAEPERSEPVPLALPHWSECMETYSMDVDRLHDAVDRGEPDAMRCVLALDEGRGLVGFEREMLYRLYRATGQEPEGLQERIEGLDRQELAAALRNAHRLSPELPPFERDLWGCSVYDPVARELLLRVRPAEDMQCLPRRFVFWG